MTQELYPPDSKEEKEAKSQKEYVWIGVGIEVNK